MISTDVEHPLEKFVSDIDGIPPLPDPRSITDGQSIVHTTVANTGKSLVRDTIKFALPDGS